MGVKDPESWREAIREGMRKPGAKCNDNKKAWETRRERYGPFGMKIPTDRKKHMEIERKLRITIFLPQICYFCGEEVKIFGNVSDGLCFHSLDGNHDNWVPENKVPMHHHCHAKHHAKYRSEKTKKKMGIGNMGPENNRKGWITRREMYGPTGKKPK